MFRTLYRAGAFLLLLVITAFLFLTQPSVAYTPILTTNGNVVRWDLDEHPHDQPNIIKNRVEFFINRLGYDEIDDNGDGTGGEFDALRTGFAKWHSVPTSVFGFNYLRLTDQITRSSLDETNLVVFDEDNSTGIFPENSGIIAVTILTYEDEAYDGLLDGRIVDTDLVFNTRDFTFTVPGQPMSSTRTMDLLAVTTHEVGHICGLTHSFLQKVEADSTALSVPTMYPYINYRETQQTSLESDDKAGLTSLYPFDEFNDAINGSIAGIVKIENEPIQWVNIVAYQNGRPVASAVTRADGTYRIEGLRNSSSVVNGITTGPYVLRAMQVAAANLYVGAVSTEFHSQYYTDPALGDGVNAGLITDASPVSTKAGRVRGNINFSLRPDSEPDFFEPDDTPETATSITPDGTRRILQFYQNGDEDWVSFEAVAGVNYSVTTDNLNILADPYLEVYQAAGDVLLATSDDISFGEGNLAARVTFTAGVDGTHYLCLKDARENGYGGGTSFELVLQGNGPAGMDANFDGTIDVADLVYMSRHWQQSLPGKISQIGTRVESVLLMHLLEQLQN